MALHGTWMQSFKKNAQTSTHCTINMCCVFVICSLMVQHTIWNSNEYTDALCLGKPICKSTCRGEGGTGGTGGAEGAPQAFPAEGVVPPADAERRGGAHIANRQNFTACVRTPQFNVCCANANATYRKLDYESLKRARGNARVGGLHISVCDFRPYSPWV